MAAREVNIYCIRHGQKDATVNGGDAMTDFGRRQVVAAAEAHLKGVEFDFTRCTAYSSEMARAVETAEIATRAITGFDQSVWQRRAFGYAWALDLPGAGDVRAVETELGGGGDVTDWFMKWPVAAALAGRFFGAMAEIVDNIVLDTDQPEEVVNLLIASHSPCCEMAAALVDKTFPRLKEADIVRYTFGGDNGGGEFILLKVAHLPCPAIED